MNLVSVDCPSCGATLPPRAPSGQYTCDYCTAQFVPQQVKHAHDQQGHSLSTEQLAQAIVQAQQKMNYGAAPPRASTPVHQVSPQHSARIVRRIMFFVMFMIVITTVVPLLFVFGGVQRLIGMGGGGGGGAVAGGGVLNSERLLWDDNGGPPAPVKIDGKPAVIGRTRVVHPTDALYIDAYTMDGERAWRVEGLGGYSEGYQFTRFGVSGDHVVVTDASGKVRIVALQTGAVEHEVALSDRVRELCRVPADDGDANIWIKQIDDKAFSVDAATGELAEGALPEACEQHGRVARLRATLPVEPPEVDDAKVLRTYQEGEIAIAAAVKAPGTEIPRAIAFDPESKEVLWDEVVSKVSAASNRQNSSEFSALAAGRYFAVYGEGQDLWHVAALDAKTGTSLWDVKLREIFAVDSIDGLFASDTHVFVVRTSSMEVLDASSGELVLTIGTESYD